MSRYGFCRDLDVSDTGFSQNRSVHAMLQRGAPNQYGPSVPQTPGIVVRSGLIVSDLFDESQVQTAVKRAARRASVEKNGVHVLRHTFCSHLAMRGAPVRAIQELAGHRDLTMTQRYMHVSPAAIESAVRLLDEPAPRQSFGDIVETGG